MKFTEKPDRGTTGNFEITIAETGQLIHSKKQGKGKCETQAEKSAVFEKIAAHLRTKA